MQRADDERKRLIDVNDTAMDTCQDLEGREAEIRAQLDKAEAQVSTSNQKRCQRWYFYMI